MDKNYIGIVPNKIILMYKGGTIAGTYNLIRGKEDILIYGDQPKQYYEDWEESGNILIVKYDKTKSPKMAYKLLHHITVNPHNGGWDTEKLDCFNRMLTPVYD